MLHLTTEFIETRSQREKQLLLCVQYEQSYFEPDFSNLHVVYLIMVVNYFKYPVREC